MYGLHNKTSFAGCSNCIVGFQAFQAAPNKVKHFMTKSSSRLDAYGAIRGARFESPHSQSAATSFARFSPCQNRLSQSGRIRLRHDRSCLDGGMLGNATEVRWCVCYLSFRLVPFFCSSLLPLCLLTALRANECFDLLLPSALLFAFDFSVLITSILSCLSNLQSFLTLDVPLSTCPFSKSKYDEPKPRKMLPPVLRTSSPLPSPSFLLFLHLIQLPSFLILFHIFNLYSSQFFSRVHATL